VFLSNVVAGVEIGIEAVSTLWLSAFEEGLRPTIGAMLMPTTRTGLTGMPWVHFDHPNTACFRFVRNKGVQLSERPAMHASFVVSLLALGFAASHHVGLSNVLEVLKSNGRACGGVLYDAFTQDMIVVFASPKLFARKLSQVPFG
jgi:hypothetical protein